MPELQDATQTNLKTLKCSWYICVSKQSHVKPIINKIKKVVAKSNLPTILKFYSKT